MKKSLNNNVNNIDRINKNMINSEKTNKDKYIELKRDLNNKNNKIKELQEVINHLEIINNDNLCYQENCNVELNTVYNEIDNSFIKIKDISEKNYILKEEKSEIAKNYNESNRKNDDTIN